MVAICVVFVPVGAVGAVGMPVNAGLIFSKSRSVWLANVDHTFPLLYTDNTSVEELYQSCPNIGCTGAVDFAKFSSKYT